VHSHWLPSSIYSQINCVNCVLLHLEKITQKSLNPPFLLGENLQNGFTLEFLNLKKKKKTFGKILWEAKVLVGTCVGAGSHKGPSDECEKKSSTTLFLILSDHWLDPKPRWTSTYTRDLHLLELGLLEAVYFVLPNIKFGLERPWFC
jgi:hypothetical protein